MFKRALADFPKIVKREEKAAREKKKILKAFLTAEFYLKKTVVFY